MELALELTLWGRGSPMADPAEEKRQIIQRENQRCRGKICPGDAAKPAVRQAGAKKGL